MVFEDLTSKIKACAQQMNARYAGIVFDEWPVVSLAENKARCCSDPNRLRRFGQRSEPAGATWTGGLKCE